MKIKITQACYVDGSACKEGDVVETKYANLLIGVGKAVRYTEPEKPTRGNTEQYNKRVPDTGMVQTRAPKKPRKKKVVSNENNTDQ